MVKTKINTKDKYNVLIPIYKKDGKMKIRVKSGEKDVDAYSVSWKVVGTARNIYDARRRYQDKYPECKHPILEEIVVDNVDS